MFWERLLILCGKHNCKPNTIAKAIGLSTAISTKWKNGSIPNGEALVKIADYLGCSVDYLLGRTDEPSLSSNVIGGDVTGGTVVQGTHHSSVVIHNGNERTLTDEEVELLRLFNAVDVKRRMKLLNLAFSLEEETKTEISE